MATIFEQLGGFAEVRKIVTDFYDRVLDEPLLEPFFEGIDMRRQIDHQTKFITFVMGGPSIYSDDALYKAHRHLGIGRAEFDRIVEILEETLEEHGLEGDDLAAVMSEIKRREPLILRRGE